jgi:hypothetical protein
VQLLCVQRAAVALALCRTAPPIGCQGVGDAATLLLRPDTSALGVVQLMLMELLLLQPQLPVTLLRGR